MTTTFNDKNQRKTKSSKYTICLRLIKSIQDFLPQATGDCNIVLTPANRNHSISVFANLLRTN